MRIGLLSDTHLPYPGAELWPELIEAFRDVDLMLHAGDIIESIVLDDLERIAPVWAAQGNHDPHLGEDPRVEPVHQLELEGFGVAMLHEPDPLEYGLDRVIDRYLRGVRPDVLVYGDTHFERIDIEAGTLLVNPGSATLPRNMSPRLGHVALLKLVRGETPSAEILDLAELRGG